jgi:hypothetical protein
VRASIQKVDSVGVRRADKGGDAAQLARARRQDAIEANVALNGIDSSSLEIVGNNLTEARNLFGVANGAQTSCRERLENTQRGQLSRIASLIGVFGATQSNVSLDDGDREVAIGLLHGIVKHGVGVDERAAWLNFRATH